MADKQVTGGFKVEAIHKFQAPLPKLVAGEHFWIMTAAWRVIPPVAKQQIMLDLENLITIDGPGCFWCGVHYESPQGKQPCRGDVCK